MKRQMMDEICLKLNELHIPFTQKDDTFIYVNTEFYDVGYGTEPKIVIYDLSVSFDDVNKSVFLYVKTLDKLAPNADSSREQNQVTTIFRKVRHVCYDADGKVTVIPIDLGEVPNAIKNAAFKYGWKFKTALNFNKPKKKTVTPDILPPAENEIVIDTEHNLIEASPEVVMLGERTKKAGLGTKIKKFFNR